MGVMQTLELLPEVPDYSAKWDPHEIWYDNQLVEHSGIGLLTQYGGTQFRNDEVYDFMIAQYRRFSIQPPQEDMLEYCWNFAYFAIDNLDPYVLFHGCTDVVKTEEPYYHQCAIREKADGVFEEIDCDNTEIFRLFPEGAKSFDVLITRPGLQEYFDVIHQYFLEHWGYVLDGEAHSPWADDSEYEPSDESVLLKKYGAKAQDYAHLGVWAALMWVISPMGKEWRNSYHPIFELCYEEGACLLHDWRFYPPEHFLITPRPVKSCVICGVKEWCTELVQKKDFGENFVYMCSHCQSDGVPFPGRVCGINKCTILKCPNHPAHDKIKQFTGDSTVRMLEADKRYGALRALPGGHKVRELPGMIHINQKLVQHYSNSISNDLGKVLSALLE